MQEQEAEKVKLAEGALLASAVPIAEEKGSKGKK